MSTRTRMITVMGIGLLGAGLLVPPAMAAPVTSAKERSALRISASAKSVQGFASVAIALTATPERPDRSVTLRQRSGGAWMKVTTVTVPVTSSQITWTAPNHTGPYKLRATTSGGADYLPATSNVVKVQVKSVANARWIYPLDAGTPPHLNSGVPTGPTLVTMATPATSRTPRCAG